MRDFNSTPIAIETLRCFFGIACVLIKYFLFIFQANCAKISLWYNADNSGRSAIHKLHCGEEVVHFYFEA